MGPMNPVAGPRGLRQIIAAYGRASILPRVASSRNHPDHTRSTATEAPLPTFDTPSARWISQPMKVTQPVIPLRASQVLTTIYSFPSMEPLRFEHYPASHLDLPLRKDILHRAIVFEGDKTRQGTASTKWRSEVHGSRRKLRPQKGTGRARLGDRGSPMLRGGGVAFGPKPRDFSTDLPRKMYDLAWRTALSYRYHRGELLITEDGMEIEHSKPSFVRQIFDRNRWRKPEGRSLIITSSVVENLYEALKSAGEVGEVLIENEVDVKDLLGKGRLIVEKSALDGILRAHESDLRPSSSLATIDR